MPKNLFPNIVNQIRSTDDFKLYEKLSSLTEVQRTNQWIQKEAKKNPMSIRRHLLSTSVRLTETMSPSIHLMAQECIDRLGVQLPLELYVYSSPQFNAACFKPEQERLYVMFSSSLLEGFSAQELKYVMGHELGHHIYQHHDIPIGYLFKGEQKLNPRTILELFAWSRYAEISADRAGAFCAQNHHAVASALFKLSSGLTSDLIQFDLNDFLLQVDEMQMVDAEPTENTPEADWFSTHPFSPLRVKALDFFHKSELMNESELSKDELEIQVQSLMEIMDPSYLAGKTEAAEAMRRLLFAGLIAVASASGGIVDEEKAVFEEFFGKHSFKESLNVDKLISSLQSRAEKVQKLASFAQRNRLIRDLVIMAKADNKVSVKERQVIVNIANDIDLDSNDVEVAFAKEYELD